MSSEKDRASQDIIPIMGCQYAQILEGRLLMLLLSFRFAKVTFRIAATRTTWFTLDFSPLIAAISAIRIAASMHRITRAVVNYQNDPAKSFWNRSINLALLILEPFRFK